MKFLLFLLAFPLFAAVSNLQVIGTTSTQVAVSFTITAPATACTVEISTGSGYTPLATDVDSSLYTNANLCGRSGSVQTGNHYIVVFGKQQGAGLDAIEDALTGFTLSRALYADTDYYIRITNGSSSTITARTANILLGTTTAKRLAVASPFTYKQVTSNKIVNPEFADPYTGARIANPAATMGYGYSTTTALTVVSGCNITVAGTPTIKGACRFTDATGTGWTYTTTSLTEAIQANDDNFAEYSGTTQQPLFVRFGIGRWPTHGTYGNVLASINLSFRAKTSDTAGDGEEAETCITYDGTTCQSPWRLLTLTTSEANYVVCHDSPCTTLDNPGDVMVNSKILGTSPAQAKIYNEIGSLTTLKFAGTNATAACNELQLSEPITSTNLSYNANPQNFNVLSKNCGASPPQVTVSESYDWSTNSTTGYPYWRYTGLTTWNSNFGILIRKKSTTSGSTISIDLPLLRMTFSMFTRYNAGAGGFGRNCQNVATADGYYLCMTGYEGNIIIGIKPDGSGGLLFKNYGFATWRGDQLSGNLTGSPSAYQSPQSSSTNYAPWDDELPGVFYMYYTWSGGVANGYPVLVKLTMDLTEKTVSDVDASTDPIFGSNRAPKVGLTSAVILTPCLNSCSVAADNKTAYQQRLDYSADFTANVGRFTACSIQAVQGKDVFISCTNGVQDSYSWMFTYDLGNRLPIGSGFVGTYGNTVQLYAGAAIHDTPASRWSAYHTHQAPAQAGGSPFTIMETTNKCQLTVTATSLSACNATGSGTCSACPNVTLDGFNYNGKNWCSAITFSSSDPGGVSEWEDGDPVNAINCDTTVKWLQKLEVGDFLNRNNGSSTEYIRLIERTNNKDWTIIRGFGSQCPTSTCASSGSIPAVAHSNGATWQTKGGNIVKNPEQSVPQLFYGLAWYPALSADMQDETYTFLTPFQNHGVFGIDHGVSVEGSYNDASADSSDAVAVKAAGFAQRFRGVANTFAGKSNQCAGNACEKHPSASQVLGTTNSQLSFADIHPRMFTMTSSSNEQPLASGKSYIRVYTETPAIDPKHFDIEHFSGSYPLQRVDTLTDDVTSSGKFCVAIIADDCFNGSTAGKLYMVNEAFSTVFSNGSTATCRQTQFGTTIADACATNAAPQSATLSQYQWTGSANFTNGAASRVLSKEWRYYREAATENTKADPTGTAFLNRGHWYVRNLPWPGDDTRNRATFTGIPVTVGSVPPITSTALVQFGYNSDFQCSQNRDNTCYAESATVSEATPFMFDHETLTGVSCGSGCTIMIPALTNRVVYWRMVYRNAGGTVIHRGPTNVQVVQ